jgi:phage terminase large subunit-like protein
MTTRASVGGKVRELYEGTRLGRQELQGAMILDPMNALCSRTFLAGAERQLTPAFSFRQPDG